MCKACENSTRSRHPAAVRRRLKIWEIKPQYHCALIGTCLTMDELRKVMRQCGVSLERPCSDYELHGTLVGQSSERNRASQQLQKLLERKYRRWTQAAHALRDSAELEAYWTERSREGEIAGPFWVVLSHPGAAEALQSRVYGEVHMLSHLQGSSNRADRRRLTQQGMEIESLNDRLDRMRRHYRLRNAERERLIAELRGKIRHLQSAPAVHPRHPPDADDTPADDSVRMRRLAWAEERLAERELELDRIRHERAGLLELLREIREEHAAMEQAVTRLLRRDGESLRQEGTFDLRGLRILYVGGRAAVTPHLRSLVESSNGRFLHHDGGVEDSRAGLPGSLANADLVFCPVDCVSHDACLRVKRHCRQQSKRFIPLRSSGLSAFAAGLRRYGPLSTEEPARSCLG